MRTGFYLSALLVALVAGSVKAQGNEPKTATKGVPAVMAGAVEIGSIQTVAWRRYAYRPYYGGYGAYYGGGYAYPRAYSYNVYRPNYGGYYGPYQYGGYYPNYSGYYPNSGGYYGRGVRYGWRRGGYYW